MINSGASFHATPRRDFFASYKSGNNDVGRIGNKDTSPIVGVGDIHVKKNLSYKFVLKNMRYVPDLRLNLIAPRKLDNDGYINFLGEGDGSSPKGLLLCQEAKSVVLYTRYK